MVKLLEYLSGLSVPHTYASGSGAAHNAAVLLHEGDLYTVFGPRGLFEVIYADRFVVMIHQIIQIDATIETVSYERLFVATQSG